MIACWVRNTVNQLETLEQSSELVDVQLAVSIHIDFTYHLFEIFKRLVLELLHMSQGTLQGLCSDTSSLSILGEIVEGSLDGLVVFVSLLQLDGRCDEFSVRSCSTVVVDLLGGVQFLLIYCYSVVHVVSDLLETFNQLIEAQH